MSLERKPGFLTPWIPDRFLSLFEDLRDWPELHFERGLEIFETDKDVVVKAAVPGVPSEKVTVTFEEGILRIGAHSEETKEEKGKKRAIYSRRRVDFDYATPLPKPVDEDKISAEVEDGVVTVTAPIAEEAKLKKIEVKVKTKEK